METVKAITALTHRLVKHPLDTENIVGDIWLECWLKKVHITRWLVRDRVVDALRQRSRRLKAETEAATFTQQSSQSSHQSQLDVQSACSELDARETQVIFHRFYEGKTCKETARELNVSKAYISEVQARALEKIKRKLGNSYTHNSLM